MARSGCRLNDLYKYGLLPSGPFSSSAISYSFIHSLLKFTILKICDLSVFSVYSFNLFNMKFTTISLALLASFAAAAPTTISEIVKRASLNDAAYGYASQNGGTRGGAGGTTTTVSTYAQFTAAVAGNAKKVVVLNGAITQSAKQIKVGSNTSIIGKNSSAKLNGVGL
jgi:hypothetical protein